MRLGHGLLSLTPPKLPWRTGPRQSLRVPTNGILMFMKQKVYIETSIFNYATGARSLDATTAMRQELTRRWWEQAAPLFEVVTSALAIREAGEHNPSANIAVFSGLTRLEQNEEALSLSNRLVEAGLIPENTRADALHIAIAAVHNSDYLLTWKCGSIANARHRRQFESILEKAGFACPAICTPNQLHGGVPLCSDPIIDELYQAREAFAQRFNFDVVAMAKHIREKSKAYTGERVVLAPRSLQRQATAREASEDHGKP